MPAAKEILQYIDVLIDGRFDEIQAAKDGVRGSENQTDNNKSCSTKEYKSCGSMKSPFSEMWTALIALSNSFSF
jgi:hypothetical protein